MGTKHTKHTKSRKMKDESPGCRAGPRVRAVRHRGKRGPKVRPYSHLHFVWFVLSRSGQPPFGEPRSWSSGTRERFEVDERKPHGFRYNENTSIRRPRRSFFPCAPCVPWAILRGVSVAPSWCDGLDSAATAGPEAPLLTLDPGKIRSQTPPRMAQRRVDQFSGHLGVIFPLLLGQLFQAANRARGKAQ